MATKDFLYVSNTTQGPIALNCSYVDRDGKMVDVYHTIPPARQMFGVKVPRADWDRVKNTQIVKAWVDGGFLLPEKRKVTIDQETEKTSDPKPTGDLAAASLSNLVKGNEAVLISNMGRKSKSSLRGN